MAVLVVHLLEVVAVEEEEGELALLRFAEPVDLALELPVEIAVVVEGRERVAPGDLAGAPLVEEVLEREGQRVSEQLHEALVAGRERGLALPVHEDERTADVVLDHDGHREDVRDGLLEKGVDLARERVRAATSFTHVRSPRA